MANIILTGLDLRIQEDLRQVLIGEGHEVTIGYQGQLDTADAVFCGGDSLTYPEQVRKIRTLRPNLPVVVVTRLPETSKWLDAIEAGAADYCSAPFEAFQICWLLSGILGPQRTAATEIVADTSNCLGLL